MTVIVLRVGHGSKLEDRERVSSQAQPLLAEEDGPTHRHHDGGGYDRKNRRDEDEERRSAENIEQSLQSVVHTARLS